MAKIIANISNDLDSLTGFVKKITRFIEISEKKINVGLLFIF